MNKTSHFLIFYLILSAGSVFADQKISFDEAIELAIKDNLEVQASYAAYKASQLDKKSTQSIFFPKISASLSYDKSNSEDLASGASTTYDGYTGSLNLNQNLFNGFSDMASLKIADSNILVSEANLQETKALISYDLKNAVANYTYAKNSVILSKEILKRREDNLSMVQLRFENGRENKGATLLSKAYLEQAKLDLMLAKNAMNSSLIFLRRVLNLPNDTLIDITNLPIVVDPKEGTPNFNSIIENTPTSKKFKATLANVSATLESKESGFYPSWDIDASAQRTGQSFFPNDNKRWKIGTSLTWSLFNGGKDYYSINSSNLLVKAAEKKLENQNKEQRRVLEDSYSSLKEAIQSVKVSSAFLEALKVRAEISRSKYNNGLTSFDDWDIIENDLINRQKDNTTKIRNRLIAEASWEQAQGTGVIP